MTVYRRYHELLKNLERTRQLAQQELGYIPDVVLVWAQPEVCRLWLIQDLLAKGWINHVVGRPALPGEAGSSTTYPESHNIRMGLNFVKARYDASHFVIFQTADIWLQNDTLGFVNGKIQEGHGAVVFHWENHCVREGVWHTNFFATTLQEEFWPPVSEPGNQDVLERQWGLKLGGAHAFRWHNYAERRFCHRHESEKLEPIPSYPQRHQSSVSFSMRGFLPWYIRLWGWIRGVFKRRR